MTDDKIIDLVDDRADLPDEKRKRDVTVPADSHCLLGQTQTVAQVSILNGDRVHASAFYGRSETGKLALIGALHQLIRLIEDDDDPTCFVEKVPGPNPDRRP